MQSDLCMSNNNSSGGDNEQPTNSYRLCCACAERVTMTVSHTCRMQPVKRQVRLSPADKALVPGLLPSVAEEVEGSKSEDWQKGCRITALGS